MQWEVYRGEIEDVDLTQAESRGMEASRWPVVKVKFAGHAAWFRTLLLYCGKEACGCREVELQFAELKADGLRRQDRGVAWEIRLDVDTGAIRFEHPVTGLAAELAREYEAGLTGEALSGARGVMEVRMRGLQMGRMQAKAYIGSGATGMVRACEFFGGPREEDHLPWLFHWAEDGKEWIVLDDYCGNDGCNCREAMLIFLEQRVENHAKLRSFSGTWTLDGRCAVRQTSGISEEEGLAVFRRWLAEGAGQASEIRWRYRKIREFVKVAKKACLPKPLASAGSVGPNDPCPCGSGRKHKRCCGRG